MSRFWVPRKKSELLKMIFESGKWNGLRGDLRAMPTKQIRAIFIRIRNQQFIELSRGSAIKPTTQETL